MAALEDQVQLTFMDLSGKEIENPNRAIHEMNRRFDRDKINYQAKDETTKIGFAELWGLRATQEDRVAMGKLDGFSHLSESDRHLVLVESVTTLQKLLTQMNLGYQGSTFCSTIFSADAIYTTNAGDGTAFLCLIDKDQHVTLELLNTRHNPTEPSEALRLRQNNKLVIHQRIGGVLAVSRALGDNDLEENGLSHVAEVTKKSIQYPKGGAVLLINACDGLTESDEQGFEARLQLLKDVIKNNYKAEPHVLARELAIAALHAEVSPLCPGITVGDNISVMVLKLSPAIKDTIYMLVCDGHGGDEVAEFATQLYQPVLANQILLAQLKNKAEVKFAELTEGMLTEALVNQDIQHVKDRYLAYNQLLFSKLNKMR